MTTTKKITKTSSSVKRTRTKAAGDENVLSQMSLPQLDGRLFDLYGFPGHLIRRVHQIAVAHFYRLTDPLGVTPVQYACITAIGRFPGIDHKTLAQVIAFDSATISGVIERLRVKGLVDRIEDPSDRRVRRLRLTVEGQRLLKKIARGVDASQDMLVRNLSKSEREQFVNLLRKIAENND